MQSRRRMAILSRLMAHFGYVRLKDYGYELTSGGKIVEVMKIEDDRFAPPPWQPVGFQNAASLLPPVAAKQPPTPRPLAPPPEPDEDPQPLFKVPGAAPTVETSPPGKPVTVVEVEEEDDDSISIDEAPEEEEWEWKMALARAREIAEKDKKERHKAKQERMAARRGQGSTFKTSSLPLAAPPARTMARVVDTPKPMSKIARPAAPRKSALEPVRAAPEPTMAEPRKPAPEPTMAEPRKPAPEPKMAEPRKPAPEPKMAEPRKPAPEPKIATDQGWKPPERPIQRVEPRAATAQPGAPRTAPPKAPPGSPSRPLPSIVRKSDRPGHVEAARPAPRAALEKQVSRAFSPAAPSKPAPLPRLARGTDSPPPARGAQPIRPQMALGSGRMPAMRDPSHDVTATDITAVDRAQASMRDDEDTRVNVVVPPSAEITLDIAIETEEQTTVDPQPQRIGVVSVEAGTPLPRLTARLRRQSVPN
jgi:hypothetical protein